MADLTITAASVVKGSGATTGSGIAGASITAGQALYLDAASSTLKPTDPTAAGGAKAQVVGVALCNAASGQPVIYQTGGQITIGATVVVGGVYILSHNAGGLICPVADVNASDYVTILGVASTTGIVNLSFNITGIQHA